MGKFQIEVDDPDGIENIEVIVDIGNESGDGNGNESGGNNGNESDGGNGNESDNDTGNESGNDTDNNTGNETQGSQVGGIMLSSTTSNAESSEQQQLSTTVLQTSETTTVTITPGTSGNIAGSTNGLPPPTERITAGSCPTQVAASVESISIASTVAGQTQRSGSTTISTRSMSTVGTGQYYLTSSSGQICNQHTASGQLSFCGTGPIVANTAWSDASIGPIQAYRTNSSANYAAATLQPSLVMINEAVPIIASRGILLLGLCLYVGFLWSS